VDPEAVLLHQVHPVKLAADISASVISNALLWQHRLLPGLLVRYLLPIAGSALVLSTTDMTTLRGTAAGQYVLAHMPPAAQAIRLAGDVVMLIGAWRRSPTVLLAGAAIIIAGWSHGLLPHSRAEARGL
jgi:hypothetical protein